MLLFACYLNDYWQPSSSGWLPSISAGWGLNRIYYTDTDTLVPADEREARVKDFIKRMRYKGPVFQISALTREGCEPLIKEIYKHIRAQQIIEQGIVDIDPRFTEQDKPQEPDADDPRFKALPTDSE